MSLSARTTEAKPDVAHDGASFSLPAWTYANADFMALEREKVFLPAWHLVCHASDIPHKGDYATLRLFGESAVVVRGKDDRLRAFHNVCRHRAARLLDGHQGQCGARIVCPYHAWTYGLDGVLIGVPQIEAYEHFDKGDHGLVEIECDTFAGFLFVRFRDGGPSLASDMAPIADEAAIYRFTELKPLRRIGERVRAVNWKNAMDNYVDALHIPVAHDGLHGLLGHSYRLEVDRGVYKIYGDLETLRSKSASNRAYCDLLPEVDHLPAERRRLWTYYKLFPSLAFDVYPDQIDFMQFFPLTPTTCLLRESAYALGDDRREMKAARYLNMRINRDVNREDRALIERVQAGMASSSFQQGPLGRNEICLRDFAQRMRAAIPLARERHAPSRDAVHAALAE